MSKGANQAIYFKNFSNHEAGKYYSFAARTDKRSTKNEKAPSVGTYNVDKVKPEVLSKNKRLSQGGAWGKAQRFKDLKYTKEPGPGQYGIHTKSTLGHRTIKFATSDRGKVKYDMSIPGPNKYDIRNMNVDGEGTFTTKTIKFSLTGHSNDDDRKRAARASEPGPGKYGAVPPTGAESQFRNVPNTKFAQAKRPPPEIALGCNKCWDVPVNLPSTLDLDHGRSFTHTNHFSMNKMNKPAGADVDFAPQMQSFGGPQ